MSPTDVRYESFASLCAARALLPAAAICFGLAAWGISDLARAQSGNHGDGHAEHHDMYKDWEQPDVGGSCCNAQSADDPAGDCRPTTAYIGDDGRWHARVGPGPEDFAIVPPNKILHRAFDGRCHICGPAELAVALEERGFDIVLDRRNSEHLPPIESPAK